MIADSHEIHEKIERLTKSKGRRVKQIGIELTHIQEATANIQTLCSDLFRDGKPIPEETMEIIHILNKALGLNAELIKRLNIAIL